MSYSTTTGQKRGRMLVAKPSAAETASTTSPAVDVGDAGSVQVIVDVTAVGGTPTMLIFIEGSDDGTTWYTVGRIGANGFIAGDIGTDPTNITGVSTKRACFTTAQQMRSRSVIGGASPSLTYSVTFQANT